MDIPHYFADALATDSEAKEIFEALSSSHQREYLQWLAEAKTEETRTKRIAKTLEMLKEKSASKA
jgi:uncharacterized protein YdeI (YjbR/CyaY-like superfamily)